MVKLVALVAGCIALSCVVGCAPTDDSDHPTGAGTTASGGAGGSAGAGGGGGMAGAGGSGGSSMTFESSAIMPDMAIPDAHTCAGTDSSPPLDWTPGPTATKSYAVVLKDQTNDAIHWVIWDIPPSVLALAGNIPKLYAPPMPSGAKQAKSYDMMTNGYLGPCPGGMEHTYTFLLYAMNVDTLPGVSMDSQGLDAAAQVLANQIDSATFSATSSAQ